MANIMIVDDSAYARRVHRRMLEQAGHTVTEASSGTQAIESFSISAPDIVLLDLSMEDINGIEVLRTLRQLNAAVPVVVISADVQRTTEQAVREAGAERFIAKPASAEDLLGAVTAFLKGSPS